MALRQWWTVLAVALAIALGACGDDDTGSGAAGGSAATGGSSGSLSSGGSSGTSGVNTGGGAGGINAGGTGAAGVGAGVGGAGAGGFGGFGGRGGTGGSGGTGGTFMMAMCPMTMPQDGSACMGRRLNCMFGDVQCLCRFGMWSCDSPSGQDMDGGTP